MQIAAVLQISNDCANVYLEWRKARAVATGVHFSSWRTPTGRDHGRRRTFDCFLLQSIFRSSIVATMQRILARIRTKLSPATSKARFAEDSRRYRTSSPGLDTDSIRMRIPYSFPRH